MNNQNIVLLVLVVVLLVLIYRSLAIAAEDERFALFVLGRFAGFRGPGLIFKSEMSKLHRVKVGDVGVVESSGFVTFGDTGLPMASASAFKIGDAVRIDSFDEAGPVLAASATRPKQLCPKCGHSF